MSNLGGTMKKAFKAYLVLLPSLTGFFLLYILPFVIGLKYSVQRSSFNKEFVGLKNYMDIFDNEAFTLALKNNMIFMVIGIPLIIILSFVVSVAIYELKVSKFIKFALIIPIAIPSAAVAGFFKSVFDAEIFSLIDSQYAMLAVIIIYIWRSAGFNIIIYTAALSQMNKSAIEASSIDGATYLQRLYHIIMPMMIPSTFFVAILSIMNSFKVFKDIYILQGKYPNPQIYMLQHYMNNIFSKMQIERLTTAAYIFTAFIFLFALVFYRIERNYLDKVGD